MNHNPLVSIIIPTYNRAHLIGETLDSVLVQTYINWECIIVDDGSTDNTAAVVQNYLDKDSRFQYYHRPADRPKGANACRNYGFEVSKGIYINWLDSDDIFAFNKLEAQIALIKDKSLSVVTCKWGQFSENISNAKIKENEPYYNFYSNALDIFNAFGSNGGFFPSHAYLVSRKIINISGLWNTNLRINQDGEFFCRVLIASKQIIFQKDTFVYYRTSIGDNITIMNSSKKADSQIYSWKLISTHIKNAYDEEDSKYVKKAKGTIYRQISKNYPFIIYKNGLFFKTEIFKNSIFYKMLIKIKHSF